LIGWTFVLIGVPYLLIAVLSMVLPLYHQPTPPEIISYTEFLDEAGRGAIDQVTVRRNESVEGRLRDGRVFRVFVPNGDTSYLDVLRSKGVTIRVEGSRVSPWPTIATAVLPFLILVGILLSMFRFQPRWRS